MPDCLALRYPSTIPPVSPEILRAFVAACGVAGVQHFSQAVKLIDSKGVSYRRMLAALPDQVCRVIRGTFLARRMAKVGVRKLESQVAGQKRRALAVDLARSRKLDRLAGLTIRGRGTSGVESPSGGQESKFKQARSLFKRFTKGLQERNQNVGADRTYRIRVETDGDPSGAQKVGVAVDDLSRKTQKYNEQLKESGGEAEKTNLSHRELHLV
jgi:hypothetical protein